MALPIDRMLQTEPDVRILPSLRRGGIDPSDVVLLHLGGDGGILLAPPSGRGDACRLTWRLPVPASPFDETPATVDGERGSAGWLACDLALAGALEQRLFEYAGQIAWRRLAAALAGRESTIARLVMARLRLLASEITGGDLIPALPDLGRTLDVYRSDRSNRPVARLWPGSVPDSLWERVADTPVFVGGAFQSVLHLSTPTEPQPTAHRRAYLLGEAEAARKAFAAAWPEIAVHDFPPGVHLERLP